MSSDADAEAGSRRPPREGDRREETETHEETPRVGYRPHAS